MVSVPEMADTVRQRAGQTAALGDEMKTRSEMKYAQKGRGQNKKGRSKQRDRFVKLDHWLQDTEAWRSLRPAPRALYIELVKRYYGINNGEISLSVREAAGLLHVAKDTAGKAFKELEAKGFIRRNVCGSFNWKAKQATTWVLTNYEFKEEPATKEFARWMPEKKIHGPKPVTHCPGSRTLRALLDRICSVSVLHLGPWTKFRLVFGPNQRHAYSLPCHAQIQGPRDTLQSSVAGCVETSHIAAQTATRLAVRLTVLLLAIVGGISR